MKVSESRNATRQTKAYEMKMSFLTDLKEEKDSTDKPTKLKKSHMHELMHQFNYLVWNEKYVFLASGVLDVCESVSIISMGFVVFYYFSKNSLPNSPVYTIFCVTYAKKLTILGKLALIFRHNWRNKN